MNHRNRLIARCCMAVAGFAAALGTAGPVGAQSTALPNLLPSSQAPAIARRQTPIDKSGNYRQEIQACLSGRSHQDKDTCLREARNARAAKRQGALDTGEDYMANALARCEPFTGQELASCQARVMGFGNASGSVAGGGLLRWVETVVMQPGDNRMSFVPRTTEPVVVVPAPNS
jgi:hypothetical protein